MKIIYGGGYNKDVEESIQNSFIFSYQMVIKNAVKQGKKVAFVTLAKPDGYFDGLIYPFYKNIVEVINRKKIKKIDWTQYDLLFLFGGNTMDLYNNLVLGNFSLNRLKKNSLILGDSAGAYVLSSYFYNSPPGKLRGRDIEFLPGFNPEAKIITIAHKDNPVYCNDVLIDKVGNFAQKKRISVIVLEENEQVLLSNGAFIKFNKSTLF